MARLHCICLAMACAMAAAGAPQAAAETWTTYVNARFGTSAMVPLHLFPGGGVESDNGDGAAFRSADGGVSLLVWGSHGLDDMTPGELHAMAREGAGVVTAEATADGYALQAASGSRAWFEQCRIGPGADRIVHCYRLEFPAGQAASFAAMSERIAASLGGP